MLNLLVDKILQEISENSSAILASCDYAYYKNYGLDLIESHQSQSHSVPLIINCINFDLNAAKLIIEDRLTSSSLKNIFLVGCSIPHLANQNEETKLCWYKTIRYEVGRLLQKNLNIALAIIDVDALFKKDATCVFNQLKSLNIDFCIGSRFDFEEGSLFESSFIDYPWRVVKAGFSYFDTSSIGRVALDAVSSKLFNLKDKVQPSEPLKLYQAYYGDQIALLFTYLEIRSMPLKFKPRLMCLGFKQNDLISFSENSSECALWIPVKRARD